MQFLRGDLKGHHATIRPPWSVAETMFTELCSRCGDCMERCPTGIIEKDRGGFPKLNFSRGECEFCGDCVTVCIPGALAFLSAQQRGEAWTLKALIADSCITYQGVVCRSCGEQCAERAIYFQPMVAGISHPILDSSACSGCGACVRPCPVSAITITQTYPNSNAQMKSESSL